MVIQFLPLNISLLILKPTLNLLTSSNANNSALSSRTQVNSNSNKYGTTLHSSENNLFLPLKSPLHQLNSLPLLPLTLLLLQPMLLLPLTKCRITDNRPYLIPLHVVSNSLLPRTFLLRPIPLERIDNLLTLLLRIQYKVIDQPNRIRRNTNRPR